MRHSFTPHCARHILYSTAYGIVYPWLLVTNPVRYSSHMSDPDLPAARADRTSRIEIRLYPETRELLEQEATRLTAEHGIPVTTSAVARAAIREYLRGRGFKIDRV